MSNCAATRNLWWDRRLISRTQISQAQLRLLRRFPFLCLARPAQRPPRGPWRTWLFIGGRGAGKTRAGAEWTRFAAVLGGCHRIALVGPTLGDVREVMIEGPSGLRWIEPDPAARPQYSVSRRRLEWPNGAVGLVFSAEDPDSLRGPQFDAAWCDEIAVWAQGETVWNNLQFGLRLGEAPRCVATTTPRPVPLVKRLMGGEAMVTHSATRDNAAHLAAGFVDSVEAAYAGTALARQELMGELIEDVEGALWTRKSIDDNRIFTPPSDFDDLIVAVDPPTTSHRSSDACGIIAAGTRAAPDMRAHGFVLADATARGLTPSDWAARAVRLAHDCGASRLVAEANQGGEMLRTVFDSVGCEIPVELVHARLGKRARAVPVAALYAQNRISHVGEMNALEDEMCRFGTDGFVGSPDRVDALV
ncbi:MAG: DNA-packaging protein [Henriciella sp.]|nr:DNA-packaging protein [Henriciella sp.]